MDNQVSEKIKAERSEVIRKLSLKNEENYYRNMIGKKQRMLIENPDYKGFATGYGENYLALKLPSNGFNKNQFTDVRLIELNTEKTPVISCVSL